MTLLAAIPLSTYVQSLAHPFSSFYSKRYIWYMHTATCVLSFTYVFQCSSVMKNSNGYTACDLIFFKNEFVGHVDSVVNSCLYCFKIWLDERPLTLRIERKWYRTQLQLRRADKFFGNTKKNPGTIHHGLCICVCNNFFLLLLSVVAISLLNHPTQMVNRNGCLDLVACTMLQLNAFLQIRLSKRNVVKYTKRKCGGEKKKCAKFNCVSKTVWESWWPYNAKSQWLETIAYD